MAELPVLGLSAAFWWTSTRKATSTNRVVSPALMVYIVDDDAAIRQALTRLIRSAGLAVEAFASVQALLDKAPFAQRACVVADIRMPGQSGLELPRLLSRQHRYLQ